MIQRKASCETENEQRSEAEAENSGSGAKQSKYFNVEKEQLVSGRSDEKIKLIRAQGGCQGTKHRRRTWQAAKSNGESQADIEPSTLAEEDGCMSRKASQETAVRDIAAAAIEISIFLIFICFPPLD